MLRKILSVALLLLTASLADAGPFRHRRCRGGSSCGGGGYASASYSYSACSVAVQAPVVEAVPPPREEVRGEIPSGGDDALAEVNACRRAAGLRPFLRDNGLVAAARACVSYRRDRGINGHANDFSFLPPGTTAAAAGAEGSGWMVGDGWGTCCTFDNYTYAGAASAVGPDGRRFMQLFVR